MINSAQSGTCNAEALIPGLRCAPSGLQVKKTGETTVTQSLSGEAPKGASASVVKQHAATLATLPFSDTRDFDDASRGFIATREHAGVVSQQGRSVWSLEPYGFLSA